MKLKFILLLSVLVIPAKATTTIAFWDFNNAFTFADKIPQIAFSATTGSGTIFQQRADTDGNGKGGNALVLADPVLSTTAGFALAWDDIAKAGANDAELFIVFSTTGLSDISLSFDVHGNALTPVTSFDLKYSNDTLVDVINPTDVIGTIKGFNGGLSTTIFNNQAMVTSNTYQRFNFNLSSITALNDSPYVALRLDDFAGNDALRIDNVLVTGVPEISTSVMAAGSLLLMGLRRRR